MHSAQYAASLDWSRDINLYVADMEQGIIDFIERGVARIVRTYAPLIEAWMKQTAPWQDITGDARALLVSEVEIVAGEYAQIILDHGVDYGVHLELRWQGRFAVIQPALDYFSPKIFAEVRAFMTGASR